MLIPSAKKKMIQKHDDPFVFPASLCFFGVPKCRDPPWFFPYPSVSDFLGPSPETTGGASSYSFGLSAWQQKG